MGKLVTVLTFNLPQQMWVIRTRLEAEGIECFAQDELTIQSDNLYSPALGGVKLQIQEHDVARAVEILKEGGYLRDEPVKPDLLSQLDQMTHRIPLLNGLDVERRVGVIVLILVVMVTIVAYMLLV